jgi:hypothetical protein
MVTSVSDYIEFVYHTAARSIKHDVDRCLGAGIREDWDDWSDGVLEYWRIASKARVMSR